MSQAEPEFLVQGVIPESEGYGWELLLWGVARGRGPQGCHCGDQAGSRASVGWASPCVRQGRTLTGLAIRAALSGESLQGPLGGSGPGVRKR